MASHRELRLQRLYHDKRWVDSYTRDIDDSTEKIVSIQNQIDRLTVELHAIKQLRSHLEEEVIPVRARVETELRFFCPFAHCHQDILSQIFFLVAATDNIALQMGSILFDTDRASAPFIVASVSRHWRTVALSSPDLWHYAAVPSISKRPELDFARLRLVLDRSCSTGLTVVIPEHDSQMAWFGISCLNILYPELHRWLRLYAVNSNSRPLLKFIRGRTPRLELLELHYRGSDEPPLNFPSHCLAGSNALRTMTLRNICFPLDDLSTLYSLRMMWGRAPHLQQFWSHFRSAQNLQCLTLHFDVLQIPQYSGGITLPVLTELSLNMEAVRILVTCPTLLVTPNLDKLVLAPKKRTDEAMAAGLNNLHSFLLHIQKSGAHINWLVLQKYRLQPEDATFLTVHVGFRALTKLSMIECILAIGFWPGLNNPLLRSVTMFGSPKITDRIVTELLHFVRRRLMRNGVKRRFDFSVEASSMDARDLRELDDLLRS